MTASRAVFATADEIDVSVERGSVYAEGWQSWSPTTAYPINQTVHRPEHDWQQTMRFRPESPIPAGGFQAEGLLVVDPGTGAPVRSYGAAHAQDVVPTVRARLVGDRLVVEADAPVLTDDGFDDIEAALEHFGDRLAEQMNVVTLREAPTVWCSWYHYFLDVTEADIAENLAGIARHRLPVDVVQIDDGWEAGIGDWTAYAPSFGSLTDAAARIRDHGRRPGIWIAPFIVGSGSALFRQHPDWLVGRAGYNWDQDLYGLDLSHRGVRAWLGSVLADLRNAGFDYFKLDFLYAGALPGRRQDGTSPVAAYRSGLQLVRDVVGTEAYLLGCGAPILPSVGLVDAMRVSPDTYNPTVLVEPGTGPAEPRGRMNSVARAWQQGRLWVNDADCLMARPSFGPRREWAATVRRYSGLRSVSDRVADLDEWGLDTTRRFLSTVPPPTPFAVR